MHKKVLLKTVTEGASTYDVFAYVNPMTGKAIQPNPVVNGTRNLPVPYKPINPLIEASKKYKYAGMTQCDCEFVVCNDNPADGLRIGDFFFNDLGVKYQLIGIGPDGNPLSIIAQDEPDYIIEE